MPEKSESSEQPTKYKSTLHISNKKLKEIVDFLIENGIEETSKVYNVSAETLERYKRLYKKKISKNLDSDIYLRKIFDQYSESELKVLAQGGRIVPGQEKVPIIDFEGEHVRFGYMSDTHIGSIFFKPCLFDKAIKEYKKEGCEFIIHTGDVTDGLSRRPGHIYELDHIGYERQRDYSVELMSKWDKKWYLISGNHDRWYLQNSNLGANIVDDVAKRLPSAEFLGHDEGDISLKGISVKLWHGLDSNTYAVSYRVQKILESLTGGEKPHILLCGHTHKQLYMFERHVHAVSSGALSLQSSWMRGKRISNHTGFWIIDVWINKDGVSKFCPTWYALYQ